MNACHANAGLLDRGLASGRHDAASLAEDPTVCFVDHTIPRACPACATVFKSSAWTGLLTGLSAACPYCGHERTDPVNLQ